MLLLLLEFHVFCCCSSNSLFDKLCYMVIGQNIEKKRKKNRKKSLLETLALTDEDSRQEQTGSSRIYFRCYLDLDLPLRNSDSQSLYYHILSYSSLSFQLLNNQSSSLIFSLLPFEFISQKSELYQSLQKSLTSVHLCLRPSSGN